MGCCCTLRCAQLHSTERKYQLDRHGNEIALRMHEASDRTKGPQSAGGSCTAEENPLLQASCSQTNRKMRVTSDSVRVPVHLQCHACAATCQAA